MLAASADQMQVEGDTNTLSSVSTSAYFSMNQQLIGHFPNMNLYECVPPGQILLTSGAPKDWITFRYIKVNDGAITVAMDTYLPDRAEVVLYFEKNAAASWLDPLPMPLDFLPEGTWSDWGPVDPDFIGNAAYHYKAYTFTVPDSYSCDPEPTATNTPEPTATNTPEPTATNTPEPTATNTPEPTATNTPEPTATNTPEPTATNTQEPTATSSPTSTPTATSPAPPQTPSPTSTPPVVTEVPSTGGGPAATTMNLIWMGLGLSILSIAVGYRHRSRQQ